MTLLLRAAPIAAHDARTLLEREDELRAVDDALTMLVAGAGTAIVVEGEAGIGKSAIAGYAIDEASRRGFHVVRAQGAEFQRALPYGVVLDLFGSLAHGDLPGMDLFAGPAAITRQLFGVPGDRGAVSATLERPDPVAYLHGLFWLVLNLVEHGPLVIVVDDAHWADDPSLRFLLRIAGRVDEIPVLVLVATRSDGESADRPALTRLLTHRAATHLVPDPLSEPGVGALMARLTGRHVDDELRQASWRATRGNPFFVTELGSELAKRSPDRTDAQEVESFIPERVGRYVQDRLAGADPSDRRLAESIAILGDAASLHRAKLVAGLEPRIGVDAARRLAQAGILADDSTLAFRHPIVRSGILAAIPGPVRAALHRRSALLLADEDADISVISPHLDEADPSGDQRVVELLQRAAAEATSRGEPQVAAALLRRALLEPPDAGRRANVFLLLARAEAASGSATAPETFAQALTLTDAPLAKAALQLELGLALVANGQWPAAREAFEQGLANVSALAPGSESELRARLEAGFLSTAWITMEDRAEVGARLGRILAATEIGAANRDLVMWIAFQQSSMVSAAAPDVAAMVKRAFAEAPIDVLAHEGQVIEVGAGALLQTDELPLEVDILTRALEAARTSGPIAKAGIYAYCRSWPHLVMGRLTDAIADAEEALRAAEVGWETFVPAAATVASLAYIERDELDAAEQVVALDPERWGQRIDSVMLLPLAAGRLALARGDAAGAAEHLRRAGESAGTAFMRSAGPSDWRGPLAIALLGLERRDEARDLAQELLEIARAWGAAWPLGNALRVAGVVEGGRNGLSLLREAEGLLSGSPARLEHARLLVDLGAALRRNGSLTDAREVLARAADLSRQIGARRLLARATAEQRAAGARPRRVALTGVESLTPAEARVVQEAVAGRTNREIAQALFVTPKAVEFHLANAYRKLHIGSRGELAGVMAPAAPATWAETART